MACGGLVRGATEARSRPYFMATGRRRIGDCHRPTHLALPLWVGQGVLGREAIARCETSLSARSAYQSRREVTDFAAVLLCPTPGRFGRRRGKSWAK